MSCDKNLKRQELRAEFKCREEVQKRFLKEVRKCELDSLLPCGMLAACKIVEGGEIGDQLQWTCDGYCGNQHRNLALSGDWRRGAHDRLMRKIAVLESKISKMKEEIETLRVEDYELLLEN